MVSFIITIVSVETKGCSTQYLCVVTVLNSTRNMAAAHLQMLLNQSADPLMASEWSLRRMAAPLSDAEDALNRLLGLNLKSLSVLGHVEVM